MKKNVLVSLLLIISISFLFSCKDEDDDFVKDPDLIGRWYMYSSEQFGVISLIPHCKDKKTHLNFRDNGVFQEVKYHPLSCKHVGTEKGRYKLKGNVLTQILNRGNDKLQVPYDYVVNKDKLILTTKEEKEKYRVTYVYKRME